MISEESILIVDDESGPRESLRIILKPMYDVYTAKNGQEAINFFSQNKVDLVTLDLKMPGLSGIDVLKEIKKLRPDTEVMIVTGYGTLDNAQEAIGYGVKDFISKPFNVPDIISMVSKAFERRRYNIKVKSLIQAVQTLRSSLGENKEFSQNEGKGHLDLPSQVCETE